MRGQIIFSKIEIISEVSVNTCKTNTSKVMFRAKTKEGEIFLFQAFDACSEKIQHMNLEKGIRVSISGEIRQYVDQKTGWVKDFIKAEKIDYADDKEIQRTVAVKEDLSRFRSKEVL